MDTKQRTQNPTLAPRQNGYKKFLEEASYNEAATAYQAGVPLGYIESQSGLGQQDEKKAALQAILQMIPQNSQAGQTGTLNPDQITNMVLGAANAQSQVPSNGNAMPKMLPAKGVFGSAGMTPEGNIQQSGFAGGLFGQSTVDVLDNLVKLSEIQKNQASASGGITPNQLISTLSEQSQESRRIESEGRRQKEFKIENISKFGANFSPEEIQDISQNLGIDLNSTVEAYGLQAVKEPDGSRRFRIPPQKILDKKAEMQAVTPVEQEYFQDNFVLVDRLRETKEILSQMGIKPEDFEKMGKIQYEEVQTNLGPLSVPARFQFVAQLKGDRELVRLGRKFERLFQSYRKVITGAQASAKELEILRPLFPSATDRPGILFDSIRDIENETFNNMNSRLELMGSVGRDVSKIRPLLEQRIGGTQDKQTQASEQPVLSDEEAYQEYLKLVGGE